jgi:hypothetical protein
MNCAVPESTLRVHAAAAAPAVAGMVNLPRQPEIPLSSRHTVRPNPARDRCENGALGRTRETRA